MAGVVAPAALSRQPQHGAQVAERWAARLTYDTTTAALGVLLPRGNRLLGLNGGVPQTNNSGTTYAPVYCSAGVAIQWTDEIQNGVNNGGNSFTNGAYLVVIGPFASGAATSIASMFNGNSAAWYAGLTINASGQYALYDNQILVATGTQGAQAGDAVVVIRVGTSLTCVTPREVITVTTTAGGTPNFFTAGRCAVGNTATSKSIALFAGFSRGPIVTLAEAKSLVQNPWQLFKTPRRNLWLNTAGGTNSLTVTPTGGLMLAGAAGILRLRTLTGAGGLALSGSAPQARATVRTAAGGLSFAGAAAQARARVVAAVGGMSFAGAAAVLRAAIRTATGGLLFGGTAPYSSSNGTQSRTVTPTGGLLLSGAATVVRTTSRLAAGGISFAGAAAVQLRDATISAFNYVLYARRRGRR